VVSETGLFFAAGRDATESPRAAEEQAALRRVATLVARESAPDVVLAAVAREVGQVLGADATHVGRYDADGTVVSVAQWGRYPSVPTGSCLRIESAEGQGTVLTAGLPLSTRLPREPEDR
jgi:GAF domain-containing protein